MKPISRITAQGQISVPAEVRKDLGAGPGSLLEWDKRDGEYVVRRTGGVTFADMRRILWGDKKPKKRTLRELKQGIADYIIEKHGPVRSKQTKRHAGD